MDSQQLQAAVSGLRSTNSEVAREALEELAVLAAGGCGAALRPVLQQVLERRLAERAVRTILIDPADIDDAVQTTLIAVAEKISTFQGTARFTTWVDRVARNEALMLVRRRQRKSEPVSNQLPESDRRARRLSSLIAQEHAVRQALAQLSVEHRQALHLREELGLTYDEIAASLSVPVGTVRSRINRARRTLAELLLYVDDKR